MILLVLAVLIVPVAATQRTSDAIQTIPPIIVSGPNAIAGCTVLNLTPGSIVTGTSGFVQANCPNNTPAILLNGTETAAFLLSTGWTQISLMFHTYPCSFNFRQVFHLTINGTTTTTLGRLIGMNITASIPLTFTSASDSTTVLMAGGYNYCLYYQNPPANGIATFTVSWTP